MGANGFEFMVGCASVGMRDGIPLRRQPVAPGSSRPSTKPRLSIACERAPAAADAPCARTCGSSYPLLRGYLRCGAAFERTWRGDPDFGGGGSFAKRLRWSIIPSRFRRLVSPYWPYQNLMLTKAVTRPARNLFVLAVDLQLHHRASGRRACITPMMLMFTAAPIAAGGTDPDLKPPAEFGPLADARACRPLAADREGGLNRAAVEVGTVAGIHRLCKWARSARGIQRLAGVQRLRRHGTMPTPDSTSWPWSHRQALRGNCWGGARHRSKHQPPSGSKTTRVRRSIAVDQLTFPA